MTEAEQLLESYRITDGMLEKVYAQPGKIVLWGFFTTFHGEENWTSRSVEIELGNPVGASIHFDLYPAFKDEEYGDFGGFRLIDAKGPLNAASFRLETDQGHVAVGNCNLQIRDWDDSEWLQ